MSNTRWLTDFLGDMRDGRIGSVQTGKGAINFSGSSVGSANGITCHAERSTFNGNNMTITGDGNTLNGDNITIRGDGNVIQGNNATVHGNGNTIRGNNATVQGNSNIIQGNDADVHGDNNRIEGDNGYAEGKGNRVSGSNTTSVSGGAQAFHSFGSAYACSGRKRSRSPSSITTKKKEKKEKKKKKKLSDDDCGHKKETPEKPSACDDNGILDTPNGQDTDKFAEGEACVICLTNKRQLMPQECSHYCMCYSCAWKLIDRPDVAVCQCPICKKVIAKKMLTVLLP